VKKLITATLATSLFLSSGAAAEEAIRASARDAPAEIVSPVPFLSRLPSNAKIVSIKPLIEEAGFLAVYCREYRVLVTEYVGNGPKSKSEMYYDAVILRPKLAEYYWQRAVDVGEALREFRNYERKLEEHRREREAERVAKLETSTSNKPDKPDKKVSGSKNESFKVRTVRKPKDRKHK
jgi:hypothetical protein